MNAIRTLSVFALVLILCMTLLCLPASAHRVVVVGQVHEMQVMAYYGGGAPMIDADVEIYTIKDGQEDLYLTGKTDLEGMFYFEPKIGVSDYRAVVEATGHQGYEFVNLTGGAGVPEAEKEGTELPLMQMFAGFGYLAGLIGISMILAARKMKKQHENK